MGAQLLCAIKGLRYFSTLRFPKTVRLFAVALLHPLPPSFYLRHLLFFAPDHTQGLFASFSVDPAFILQKSAVFFLTLIWFGGGNSVTSVELAPNCEIFDPTVFYSHCDVGFTVYL